jgi:D-alanine-D-alanine ligase
VSRKKKPPAKKLRVLALVHPDLVPPATADPDELPGKPWKTEYDVVRTLEALGHEV